MHLRLARRMPPSGAAISPEARSYVLEALAKVEQVSIFPPSQGWPQLRAWTLEQAAGARTPSDTYPALQLALQQLQDRHSSFNLPAPASEAAGVTRAGGDGQLAPAFGSESGVLSIPAFMDRRKGAFERFAADLREALEAKTQESQCGLVIDLRNNGGGNMWPMLVGISALFPDQVLGQFVTAEGAKSWSARDGIINLGDYPVMGSIAGAHLRDVPVAVLIGPHAASSGEAVAIALRSRPRTVLVGRPTADYVTANRVLELRDGAYVAVSASRMADPAGLIQEGPVEPTLRGTGGEDDLQIARNWLKSQCAR
ncbi:S41 family peptidase [Ramlibacter sp. MMS24-I3-19]|uniref:S41 family peptidase n=1 Tax=Ramlibacter sp. MMS24-I3-19 TaxID=3416606 RepID=UPI003D07A534